MISSFFRSCPAMARLSSRRLMCMKYSLVVWLVLRAVESLDHTWITWVLDWDSKEIVKASQTSRGVVRWATSARTSLAREVLKHIPTQPGLEHILLLGRQTRPCRTHFHFHLHLYSALWHFNGLDLLFTLYLWTSSYGLRNSNLVLAGLRSLILSPPFYY